MYNVCVYICMYVYIHIIKMSRYALYSYFESIHHSNISLSTYLLRYNNVFSCHKHIIGQSVLQIQ